MQGIERLQHEVIVGLATNDGKRTENIERGRFVRFEGEVSATSAKATRLSNS